MFGNTIGGHGGRIIRVTTLAEDGPGSLKEAVETTGPRLIVFEAGGTIWLPDTLTVREPFLTIAGQTAPAPGITLAGSTFAISTHDVIVRHLRVRPGDGLQGTSPVDRDGLSVQGRSDGLLDVFNVLIEYCSFSWAIDENIQIWYPGVHDVTIRHCIISEGLQNSIHPKGSHSCGLLIGGVATRERVAVIGNLFAHNVTRNPRAAGGSNVVVVNNVVYNAMWDNIEFGNPDTGLVEASVVGNVILPGPDARMLWAVKIDCAEGSRFFLLDNEAPGRTDDPWSVAKVFVEFDVKADTPPLWPEGLVAKPSGEVLEWVLANAGARPWDRDDVDERIVSDVQNGTGRIIDSQEEVGGWPSVEPTYRVLDLPDDPWGDDDWDGISNLDEYVSKLEGEMADLKMELLTAKTKLETLDANTQTVLLSLSNDVAAALAAIDAALLKLDEFEAQKEALLGIQ